MTKKEARPTEFRRDVAWPLQRPFGQRQQQLAKALAEVVRRLEQLGRKYDQMFDLLEAAIVARNEREQREAAKARTAAIQALVDAASKRCLDGPAMTQKRGPVRTFADRLLKGGAHGR